MVKKSILALCALFVLVLSCSKKDKDSPSDSEAKKVITAIQDYLSQTDSLKTFGTSFQKTTIADADATQGLTVFAPVNSSIAAYDPNARLTAAGLSESEVKDHIVAGVFKKADLTNGKKLTTLSGKELVISIDGDRILVNGTMVLSVKEDIPNAVVYTMSNVLCQKPGGAEITVYDGTTWSTTDTLGKPAAGADVILYRTRADFRSNTPAYSAKTDANGKAVFPSLPTGTYYIVSKKDDKSNIVGGLYTNGSLTALKPIGIFLTTDQVNALPHFSGAVPGDFIFLDANGDQKLDVNDAIAAPFDITVSANKTVQIKSLIGYYINHMAAPFTTLDEAQKSVDNVNLTIGGLLQQIAVIDGIMSDDADCAQLSNYCEFNNFTFTASSTNIYNLWSQMYGTLPLLNRVIRNVPLLNSADGYAVIAQAQALRALVYMELTTYFGTQPVFTGIFPDINMSRNTLAETYQFISKDLNDALPAMPDKWPGTSYRRPGAQACLFMMARLAMMQGDYTKAKEYSNDVIYSGLYGLLGDPKQIFQYDNNAEIIWNQKGSITSTFSSFFADTVVRNFNPTARLSEVLLINAEARVRLGELNADNINILLVRRGKPQVTFTSQSQALDIIQNVWKSEQYREGQRFAKMVKWGIATPILGGLGYRTYNGLLPIPQAYINQYPNLVQNPGY